MRIVHGNCDSCLSEGVQCIYIVGAVGKNICIDCLRYINGLVAIHYHRSP